jgi:hypothetical protein
MRVSPDRVNSTELLGADTYCVVKSLGKDIWCHT